MSKERQFKIPTEVLEKLPWVKGHMPYMYVNSGNTINIGVLYELCSDKYPKIVEFLEGTDYTVKAKDRIYVLPMCPTPMFKIKEFAKQLDATIVNDISKATVVLGHENLQSDDYQYSSLLYLSQSSSLGATLLNRSTISNFKEVEFKESFKEHYPDWESSDPIKYYVNEKLSEILNYSYRRSNASYFKTRGWSMDVYNTGKYNGLYATPYTVDLIYQIKLNNIPIVSLKNFQSQCEAPAVLDEDLCNTLIAMFAGSEDDKTIAMNLLVNSSVESFCYVYKIACNEYAQSFLYGKLKYKAVREFDKKYDFMTLKWRSKSDILNQLRKTNSLDRKTFNEFYPLLQDELVSKIQRQQDHLLDYFELTVKPSAISDTYLNEENRDSKTIDHDIDN